MRGHAIVKLLSLVYLRMHILSLKRKFQLGCQVLTQIKHA